MSGRFGKIALDARPAGRDAPEWFNRTGLNPIYNYRQEKEAKARALRHKVEEGRRYQEQETARRARAAAEAEAKKQAEQEQRRQNPGILSRIGKAINPMNRYREEQEAKKRVLAAQREAYEARKKKDREDWYKQMGKLAGKGGPMHGIAKSSNKTKWT